MDTTQQTEFNKHKDVDLIKEWEKLSYDEKRFFMRNINTPYDIKLDFAMTFLGNLYRRTRNTFLN
jgi:hypothetical protein